MYFVLAINWNPVVEISIHFNLHQRQLSHISLVWFSVFCNIKHEKKSKWMRDIVTLCINKQTTYMYNPLSCSQNVNEVVRCVITEKRLAPLSKKQTKPLSADIIYASSIWFESEHGSTRCYLVIQSSPKPGLIAAMNPFKKFIRSISHMCLNPNSKERARPREDL